MLAVRVGEQRRHAGILEPLPQQAQRPLRAGVEEQADGQGHGPTMADGAELRPGSPTAFCLRVLYSYNVTLTHREREVVELLRQDPLLDAAALAERIGATKAAVAVHLSNLTKKGVILGRGYVVRPERRSVVVVGGANMDLKAHSRRPAVLRTSNPARP